MPTPAATQPAGPTERLAYRPDEAAQVLGVGRTHIYDLMRAGRLRYVATGRLRLIPRAAIDELLGGPR